MKTKLTAVSVYANGRKVVAFMPLPTQTMVRCGTVDIKTTMTTKVNDQLNRLLGTHHGDTVTCG